MIDGWGQKFVESSLKSLKAWHNYIFCLVFSNVCVCGGGGADFKWKFEISATEAIIVLIYRPLGLKCRIDKLVIVIHVCNVISLKTNIYDLLI